MTRKWSLKVEYILSLSNLSFSARETPPRSGFGRAAEKATPRASRWFERLLPRRMKSYFCEGFLQQPAHKVNISRSPRSKHTLKSYSKCALCYSRARLRAVVNVVETNNSLNLPQNSDVDYPQLLNFKNEEPMADVMLSIEDVDPPNIEILDDEASNDGDSEIDNQTLLDPPPRTLLFNFRRAGARTRTTRPKAGRT